jgi:hypothetical protein
MLARHTENKQPSKFGKKVLMEKKYKQKYKKSLQSCLLFVLEAAADSLLSYRETWVGRFEWKSFVPVSCS